MEISTTIDSEELVDEEGLCQYEADIEATLYQESDCNDSDVDDYLEDDSSTPDLLCYEIY